MNNIFRASVPMLLSVLVLGAATSIAFAVDATAPTSVVLAVGSTNPVGGVTNVAIPGPGGTDTTGSVTGWAATTADTISFTVTDDPAATSTIQINSGAYTSGADYQITSTSNLSIVVTTTETGKSDVTRTFTVTVYPKDQTITFNALSGKTYGDTDFSVSATSDSGLTVAFASQTTSVCTVSGVTVHIVSQGTCTVRASQAGNTNYNAAPNVDQSFTVSKKTLTVTGVSASNRVYDQTTDASLTGSPSLSGTVGSDDVTIGGTPVATFADKTVATGKTVTVTGYTLGGAAAGNYTLTQPTLSANITAKALTVSGVTASNRAYDGTTTATLDTGSAAFVGGVSGDVVTIDVSGATGAFSDKNIGTSKTVTVSGIAKTGADAGNYTITQPTTTADITTRAITVTAAANSRTYNGLTTAAATPTLTSGTLAAGDVGTYTETYDNKNVGTSHVLTPTAVVKDAGAVDVSSNYNITLTTINTGVITAKSINVTAQADSRVYNATTTSSVSPVVDTLETGDSVGTAPTQAYDTKNVGTGKTLTPSGLVINDGNSGNNYAVNYVTATSGTITARTLTVSATAADKGYDGGTVAVVSLSDDRVTNDLLTIASTSAVFADADVGAAKNVTVSGLSISGGTDASNYTLASNSALTTATIAKKDTTGSFTVAASKVYDGTTSASTTVQTVDGKIGTDDVVLFGGTAAYASANVNTGITVSLTGASLTGAKAGNYNLTSVTSTTADITKAPSVTTVSCTASVVYNSAAQTPCTAAATGAGSLNQSLTVIYSSNTNVGTASTTATFTGDTNHTGSTDTKTFGITAATAVVTITPYSVTYDALPHTATVSAVGVGSDTDLSSSVNVSGTTHTNAGTYNGDAWTFANSNYISQNGTVNNNITQRTLTVSVTAANKVYDGGTVAAASLSDNRVSGDTFTTASTSAIFSSKNVGTSKTVTVSGLSISGGASANYTLSATSATTTANITARTLTVSASATNKVYDGGTVVSATLSDDRVGGDVFSVASTSATFANKNVGTGKTVTVSGLSISGTDAANYTLASTSATTTANITKATAVFASITPYSVTYDGNVHTATGSAIGVEGETLTGLDLSGTTHTNAGSYTADGWTFTDVTGNYNNASSTVSDSIAKATSVTVVTCPSSVTYTGSALTPCTTAITGAGGLNSTTTPTHTVNTNAGLANAAYTYPGDTNHTGSSDTKDFTITKATSTTAITCPATIEYTASALTPCTVAVTGANLNQTPTPTYAANTSIGTASASYTYAGDANHTGSSDSKNFSIVDTTSLSPASFTVGSPTETTLALSWTNSELNGSYYTIKRSTSPITNSTEFTAATTLGGSPTVANGVQGYIARNLTASTTYYFAIKMTDTPTGNVSAMSTAQGTTVAAGTPSSDTTAPAAVTNLSASAGTVPTSQITLSWGATGDDGSTGLATSYVVKRSTSTITAGTFDAATTVFNSIAPSASSTTETLTVSGLVAGTQYCFAVKVLDEAPNSSSISNSVCLTTSANVPTVASVSPSTGQNGSAVAITVTGTNFVSGTTTVRFTNASNTFDLAGTYVNATQVTASVPVGTPIGTYNVKVIDGNGESAALTSAYVVTAASNPLPAVTDVVPSVIGSNDANVAVEIYGTNFTGATSAVLDTSTPTTLTSFTVVSATKITGTIPGTLAAGTYNMKVTTPNGTNAVSAVQVAVSAPVVINSSTSQDQTTNDPIDMGNTNTIPVQVTLQSNTDDSTLDNNTTIAVVIPPATTLTKADGSAYTGNINPPQLVKPTAEITTRAGSNAVVITMGNPGETINFSNDFVTTVTLETTATTSPLVWYYNPSSGLEIAGKAGTKDGVTYTKGGKVLNTVVNGSTYTYTIGLLLDHMSSYVAGVTPTITSISPPWEATGSYVFINGTNFSPSATVKFGTTAASTIISNSTARIVVAAPSMSAGTYTITVINTDNLSATSPTTFRLVDSVSGGGGGGGATGGTSNGSRPAVVAVQGQVLGAEVYNFTKDLRTGSSGTEVTELQKALIAAGFDIPGITKGGVAYGTFGGQTLSAVIAYQKARGISPATGYVGRGTRTELNKGVALTSVPTKSALTESQTNSIVSLLASFGADTATVEKVRAALGK